MTKRDSQRGKPRIRCAIPLAANVEHRLRSYAVAAKAVAASLESATLAASAVCATGVLMSAQPSLAEVVYTPANKVLNRHGRGGASWLDLDLNNDGQTDFKVGVNFAYNYSSGLDNVYGWAFAHGAVGSNQVLQSSQGKWNAALQLGAPIGPSGKFQSHYQMMNYCAFFTGSGGSSGPWRNVTNRYLGLKFQIDGETHYGWARVNVSYGCDYTLTLTGYAYETVADKPIVAGVTPYIVNPPNASDAKPATLGALAAGASARARAR